MGGNPLLGAILVSMPNCIGQNIDTPEKRKTNQNQLSGHALLYWALILFVIRFLSAKRDLSPNVRA
jgi:hypothetical protein